MMDDKNLSLILQSVPATCNYSPIQGTKKKPHTINTNASNRTIKSTANENNGTPAAPPYVRYTRSRHRRSLILYTLPPSLPAFHPFIAPYHLPQQSAPTDSRKPSSPCEFVVSSTPAPLRQATPAPRRYSPHPHPGNDVLRRHAFSSASTHHHHHLHLRPLHHSYFPK